MTDYVTAWQCVGCGKIEAPAPCIGICADRKVELAYAVDHRAALAQAQLECQRADRLGALVRKLATTTPVTGQWERSFRALQAEARHTLAAMASETPGPTLPGGGGSAAGTS